MKVKRFKLPDGSLFSARLLTTDDEWSDQVLNDTALAKIESIREWLIAANKSESSKSGKVVIFAGPAGTDRKLTAALLGKSVAQPVMKINLAAFASKYIGETEKNLDRILSKAEDLEMILFLDEADALFGKRTETKDAHNRYANQEVSYLLNRVSKYKGLVILSSNQVIKLPKNIPATVIQIDVPHQRKIVSKKKTRRS